MFTNNEIHMVRDIVFGHDSSFNLPAAFANRVISRDFLATGVKGIEYPIGSGDNAKSSLTIVSDLLGAGKTFLVEMVLKDVGIPVDSSSFLLCGRNKPEVMESAGQHGALFIDEWDSRKSPRVMSKALEWLENYLETDKTPVVLMGDYTLKSDSVISRLEKHRPINQVPMESLDQEFFLLAVKARLAYAFKDTYFDESHILDPAKVPDEAISFLSSDIISALVPNWNQTNATFRDVFRSLHQIAKELPLDENTCLLGEREVRRWLKAQSGAMDLEREQQSTYSYFLESARGAAQMMSTPLMETDELFADLGKNYDLEDFLGTILNPLARGAIISAMGIPSITEDGYVKYPGPYLPGSLIRLESVFGDPNG